MNLDAADHISCTKTQKGKDARKGPIVNDRSLQTPKAPRRAIAHSTAILLAVGVNTLVGCQSLNSSATNDNINASRGILADSEQSAPRISYRDPNWPEVEDPAFVNPQGARADAERARLEGARAIESSPFDQNQPVVTVIPGPSEDKPQPELTLDPGLVIAGSHEAGLGTERLTITRIQAPTREQVIRKQLPIQGGDHRAILAGKLPLVYLVESPLRLSVRNAAGLRIAEFDAAQGSVVRITTAGVFVGQTRHAPALAEGNYSIHNSQFDSYIETIHTEPASIEPASNPTPSDDPSGTPTGESSDPNTQPQN
jgi:hypothetical protein